MKIPGAERAVVDDAKVRDYLLSAEHPVGGPKARFFRELGFSRQDWAAVQQIIAGFAAADARLGRQTGFGQKYIVEGTIEGRNGRTASIVVVWIVLAAENSPRFVTAYPGANR